MGGGREEEEGEGLAKCAGDGSETGVMCPGVKDGWAAASNPLAVCVEVAEKTGCD